MKLTEERLLKEKQAIETAKQEHSQLLGEQKGLLKQLQEDYDCKDLTTAKRKMERLEKELEEITDDIETKTQALESTYFNED